MSTIATVDDIRNIFIDDLANERFVVDKTGCKMLEILAASFLADEGAIFGTVNWDYVTREIEWYESMSLDVNAIPGGPPKVWQSVSDADGMINSNYGWCVWHGDNGHQYANVVKELKSNPWSRRAVMIYTRPSMWVDYNVMGRSDFMCTNTVQYLIRDDRLHAVVQMRSNDIWAGYRNDRAWQQYLLVKLASELGYEPGHIYWNAGSLHCYQKDFWMIDGFSKTGKMLTKKEYEQLNK